MSLATTTLPPGWSPDSSCQDSNDHWVWFDNKWAMGVLGPPDQTSSCYPPDFTPTLGQLYTASSCPDGFTPACTTNYYSASWSTLCCPTGDQVYTCDYRSFWSWTAACATSMYSHTTEVTNTFTPFGNSERSTDATYTASGYPVLIDSETILTDLTTTGTFSYVDTYVPEQTIYALGIPIVRPAETSGTSASSGVPSETGPLSSTSITGIPSTSTDGNPSSSPSPSTNSSSTSGLSAGAAAGIAIGAAIALILIVLGVWLLYRRGVKKGRQDGGNTRDPAGQRRPPRAEQQHKPALARWRADEYMPQRPPVEVDDTQSPRYEMGEHHRFSELP